MGRPLAPSPPGTLALVKLPARPARIAASLFRHVTTRNEQGAAFMADVHGRLTGRPAVAMATLGPGATNLLTGIADAFLDQAPMVAMTGPVSHRDSATRGVWEPSRSDRGGLKGAPSRESTSASARVSSSSQKESR